MQNNITNGRLGLALFNLIFACYMVAILMVYQAHYSIDCVIGVLCAVYAYRLILGRDRKLDDRLRSVVMDPFRKYLTIYFDTETVEELEKLEQLDMDEDYGER